MTRGYAATREAAMAGVRQELVAGMTTAYREGHGMRRLMVIVPVLAALATNAQRTTAVRTIFFRPVGTS
jgi:hypothetical protein